jgi:ATPase subunit of ABC transporter with duplicated ATPase domains
MNVNGEPLIEIEHLCKSYDKPVLKDVNLSVRRGSTMGLLGSNGAGKTTLISILAVIRTLPADFSASIMLGKVGLVSSLKYYYSPSTNPTGNMKFERWNTDDKRTDHLGNTKYFQKRVRDRTARPR